NLALFQIDIAFGEPTKNFQRVEQQFEEMSNKNSVDVVVLPELWTTGYDLTRLGEIADPNGEETIAFMSKLAKKFHVHIVAGSTAKSS
ncbi:carbon-nitrogen family hydrolase, partial [Escherichia coli]|nr:carbon-nitrogen family hydrolase [Escherichia coli]